MVQKACIGIFDSGVGGLSVWREIAHIMPSVPTLYLADQAHLPYGTRSVDEIQRLALQITRFLLSQGARLIVVACNTASGAALNHLRHVFPEVPFVGMEPAVKPAAERTQTGHVGVLATPTTFQGELFQRLVTRFGRHVTIHSHVCPGLVERIESGLTEDPDTLSFLESCLQPLLTFPIDQLVLGCTHYPFARTLIQKVVGPDITLIDPSPAVARQVKRVLFHTQVTLSPIGNPDHRFITTGDKEHFQSALRKLLGLNVAVETAEWRNGQLHITFA